MSGARSKAKSIQPPPSTLARFRSSFCVASSSAPSVGDGTRVKKKIRVKSQYTN